MSDYQIREQRRVSVVLGAAVQVIPTVSFVLPTDTRMLLIYPERIVTTAPANDPLLIDWLVSIQMRINNNIIIPVLMPEQYDLLIRNLEQYQPRRASALDVGFPKIFNPPIKSGTRVDIDLVINTLALGTKSPAVTAAFDIVIMTEDRKPDDQPAGTMIRYVRPIPSTPNVNANTSAQIQIGTDARVIQDYILAEETGGVLSNTCLAEVELLANQQRIAKIGAGLMADMYRSEANQDPPPGVGLFKLPNAIDPSVNNYQTVVLDFQMYTATPSASLFGYERYWKVY
jgi:hypothetical protein